MGHGSKQRHVIGLDLSDRKAVFVELNSDPADDRVIASGTVSLTEAALRKRFGESEGDLIALEVGPCSPWVSRLLEALGHEVILANVREVPMVHRNRRKSDRVDAELLARLARADRTLLHPTRHRSAETQAVLAQLRARDAVVQARTGLINHVRGQVKAFGARLPSCSTERFHELHDRLPHALRAALLPVLESIAKLTQQIREYDRIVAELAENRYPETAALRQVQGVGPITALTFVLTIEDRARFRRSRDVGAYLGLTPRRSQSGQSDPQLGMSKGGDPRLRRLLVQCAHYILGPFGSDSDLRRSGLRIAGPRNAVRKKKAIGRWRVSWRSCCIASG